MGIVENIVGKEENASNQEFFIFKQTFLIYQGHYFPTWATFNFVVCKCFQFESGYNFDDW